MKKYVILCLSLIVVLSTVDAKKTNPYHKEGTPEYESVTSKLLNVWKIDSYKLKKDEQMNEFYSEGTVEFKDASTGHNQTVEFRFVLSPDVVAKKLESWNKKEETVSVEKYTIVTVASYSINKKGVLVYITDPITSCVIEGDGPQLDNFRESQNALLTTSSEAKTKGGIGNLVLAGVLKEASGNVIPKIPTQINYKNLTDESCELISVTAVKATFKLSK